MLLSFASAPELIHGMCFDIKKGVGMRCMTVKRCSCRGPRYLEIDTDVGSSSTAHHVTGMVQGALKSVIVDIGVPDGGTGHGGPPRLFHDVSLRPSCLACSVV